MKQVPITSSYVVGIRACHNSGALGRKVSTYFTFSIGLSAEVIRINDLSIGPIYAWIYN